MQIPKTGCIAARVLLIGALVLPIGACQNKQQTGMAVGAASGAALGATLARGSDKPAAILVGALLGAIAGTIVGYHLDEADKAKAEAASRQAAQASSGERIYWSSDKNAQVSGYAEQVKPVSPTTQVATSSAGSRTCRKVREVVIMQGKEQVQEADYCLSGSQWIKG